MGATEYWFGNRQCHLLSGTDDLWPADDEATTIHARQHFAHARVYFLELDDVGLEGTVQGAVNRPERESNQVRIFLEGFLQALIVAGISQGLDAAGDLKGAGETRHNVAIALSVELDLAG